ncbi:hypothetical protein ACIBG6_20015 [Streptomyces sp. NPDC050842]|uniref:hypothetical protein n=1 Tax=Streptomyces sp. NPDC050842 TaxID=3365636 RepID=UPI0037AF27DD
MRFLLWLLFAAGVLANVYVNTFAGWTGATHVTASLGSGVLVLGSAVGLWLTRARVRGRARTRGVA